MKQNQKLETRFGDILSYFQRAEISFQKLVRLGLRNHMVDTKPFVYHVKAKFNPHHALIALNPVMLLSHKNRKPIANNATLMSITATRKNINGVPRKRSLIC